MFAHMSSRNDHVRCMFRSGVEMVIPRDLLPELWYNFYFVEVGKHLFRWSYELVNCVATGCRGIFMSVTMRIRLRSYSTLTFCKVGSADSIETSIALFSFSFPYCVWACPYAMVKQTESLSLGQTAKVFCIFSVCRWISQRVIEFLLLVYFLFGDRKSSL